MTTPSGTISLSDVNIELGLAATTIISMNQSNVRSLAGVPSGQISMSNLQNKSNTLVGGIRVETGKTGWQAYSTANGSSLNTLGAVLGTSIPTSAASDGTNIIVNYQRTRNEIAYSTNSGVSWTASTLPTSSSTWYMLASGGGVFVILLSGSNALSARSTNNGASWTTVAMPSTAFWNNLAYTPRGFWAVGGSGVHAYSTNGSSWTAQSPNLPSPGGTPNWVDCQYANSTYMALAVNGTGGPCVARSSDGTNFTLTTISGGQTSNQKLSYIGGSTWIVSGGATTISRSTDNGASWSTVTPGSSMTLGYSIITNGSTLISNTATLTQWAVSTDAGATWSPVSPNGSNPIFALFGIGFATKWKG